MIGRRLIPAVLLAALIAIPTVPSRARAETSFRSLQSACNPASPSPAGGSGAPLTAAEKSFGFTLFHQLFRQAPKTNTFISPASISLALEMLYGGARGSTQTAMARALEISKLSPQQVNRDAAALIDSLQRGEPASNTEGAGSTPATQLRLANSIWTRAGIPFNQSFLADAQRYFDARAQSLDFTLPSSVKTINAWVTCATRGKITSVVQSLDAAVILLINAVYFQGSWTFPFNPRYTHSESFSLGSARTIKVPMMHMPGSTSAPPADFQYYGGKSEQVVELPYGLHQRFSMVIVLPRQGISLARFSSQLTAANWGFWIKQMGSRQRPGYLAMPHINVSYSQDLKKSLTKLGMGNIFSRPNLSGMCATPCKISHVIHKTFLHLDEKGTTAAAVTAVMGLGGGGGPMPPPFHMTVNRPFFLGIRDGQSGSVLFLGAINHP